MLSGPFSIDDAFELFGDNIVGLVPTDASPAAFAARAEPLHRMRQAIRMMNDIDAGGTLKAKPPLVQRRVWVAFDALDRPVHHMDQNAAAAMAHTTGALIDLRRSGVH